MRQYVVRRILQVIPTVMLMTVLVFLMVHLAPGDPVDIILGAQAGEITAETYEYMRARFGFDKPIYVQYLSWLGRAVRGDFGRSFITKENVLPLAVQRYRNSLLLAAVAFVVAATLGVGAGVFSAVRHDSWGDRFVGNLAMVGICLPSYFIGMVLIVVFAVYLRWFPASGMGRYDASLAQVLPHLVLPACTLAAPSIAIVARMTRASLVTVFQQDYIRTARAKGLSARRVTWRHAFRNGLVSVATILGMQAGYMLGAAMLTEVVFSWPGIGSLLMTAVLQRDFPMVQGGVFLVSLTFVGLNLMIDLFYGLIDPRIRLS